MTMQLTPEVAEKIFDTGGDQTPVLVLIGNDNKESQDAQALIKITAKTLRGRCLMAFSGTQTPIEKRLVEMAGVEEDQLPVLTLIDMKSAHAQSAPFKSTKKYRHPTQGMTEKSIVQFISDFEQGKLKPWLKSEPVPEGAYDGPLTILVGTTFANVAHNPDKDVLVNFYAPWCGHCRKFEPNYKELSKRLKHVKTMTIAKLDATRNEVEGMTVKGFPTVILFPAGQTGGKGAVEYHGDRSPEDITKWLHSHCKHTFPDKDPTPQEEYSSGSGLLSEEEESDL